ncbi:hypothetical protein [Xanthomonas sp. MUS 060]|uniref:hypothetical protein n=1 Tax=Xanthomonas sp. MUS 060 TaxID=1588031 RepID=UPI000695CCAB|nr:hypothetical protein [Xanthomonas sp. MUS 060]
MSKHLRELQAKKAKLVKDARALTEGPARVFSFGEPAMSKHLRELQAKKAKLVKDARALTEGAAAENRDLTAEEVSHFDALRAQIETASAAIDREMSLVAEEARSASVAVALASSAAVQPSPAAVPPPRTAI